MSENQIIKDRTHPTNRLNSVCPYFTMFPLEFPYNILINAKKTDNVYDPFCGRGTTNYAARMLGISSFGVDSNPVAHAVAQSKLIYVKPKEIISLCRDILLNSEPPTIPSGEFWQWAYHQETLTDICRIREYLYSKRRLSHAEIALRAIILGILHGPIMKQQASYLSNQMPRTFSTKPDYSVRYWKLHSLQPNFVNLLELVGRKSSYVFNEHLPKRVKGKIILGDSRKIQPFTSEKFDWVITSPPYYGMSSYKQDQWIRNWFLGDSEKVEYSSISQLKHGKTTFTHDLAKVWENTAKKCNPGAKLVVRFGALPSRSERLPNEILMDSLKKANCGWELEKITIAGKPAKQNRQANQFNNSAGGYVEEIDAYATLNI